MVTRGSDGGRTAPADGADHGTTRGRRRHGWDRHLLIDLTRLEQPARTTPAGKEVRLPGVRGGRPR